MKKNQTCSISNMVIEITRRCNMKCEHCLRGPAQPVDITDAVLLKALEPVEHICTLTITGGEPSLRPERIAKILDICKKRRIDIESLFLATNGKKVSDEFIKVMHDWQTYLAKCNSLCSERLLTPEHAVRFIKAVNNDEAEPMGLTLAVSLDPYHEAIPAKNLLLLCGNFKISLEKADVDYNKYHVIAEGRAKTNNVGANTLKYQRPWLFEPGGNVPNIDDRDPDEGRTCHEVEDVFINATGDVMTCCDMSYKTQKNYAAFNVLTLPPESTWLTASMDYWNKQNAAENESEREAS